MDDAGLPTLHIAEGVARIRLVRPQRRNALRPADLLWLQDSLARLDTDPAVRVIELAASVDRAAAPVFCAGYDVEGFRDPRHDPRLFERTVDALESVRPVTVCALSGSVYGGATDLVLACDLRVAAAGAQWRMPASRLGLHYYPSGLRRYVAALGPNLARRAFLADRALAVEELQAAGLFDAIVAPDELDATAAALTARVAALAPLAAQGAKRSLAELARGEFDLGRLREREALTLASADFKEGQAALAERRPPRFTGT